MDVVKPPNHHHRHIPFIPMPRRRHDGTTSPLLWCGAVICAVLTTAVTIAGVIIFIGYLAIRPKVPQISITRAQLDVFNYDQAGVLVVSITVFVNAENDNGKAHATFYDTDFILGFHGIKLANFLADEPVEVEKNSTVELKYEVESLPVPLGPEGQNDVYLSFNGNSIAFDLRGTTRARWRVGVLGSFKFALRLDCSLQFSGVEEVIYPRCRTRSK